MIGAFWTFPSNRRLALILLLLCLAAISLTLSQITASQLSRTVMAQLDETPLADGCYYTVDVLALDPPDWMGRVWNLRLDALPDNFILRAYRYGDSIYMGLSVVIRGPNCLPLP